MSRYAVLINTTTPVGSINIYGLAAAAVVLATVSLSLIVAGKLVVAHCVRAMVVGCAMR